MPAKQRKALRNVIILALLIIGLALAYPVLAAPPAQGETGWIIWEMEAPAQRLLVDGDKLWVGSYQGGLYEWDIALGYQAHYTTTAGLPGLDIVGLALDSSGDTVVAALDGGLAVGGSPFFNDITPPSGDQAWAVAVGDNALWLATLGDGVAHRSSGSWSRYTQINTALPNDDVYAIAVDSSGTPWVGTLGDGLATFDSSNWQSFDLPVSWPSPLSATLSLPNSAINDIAIDDSDNKWLATDGSGVVVLDSSNTNWTVYDTTTSDLPDNFVHSVTLTDGDLWFGTLGGGAAQLSGGTWQIFNTATSPLPEDDVLDIAVDVNGGRWFATFETGLTYHGPLPPEPPLLELDPLSAPPISPGQGKSYDLWLDPETYLWTLVWSGGANSHNFSGSIIVDTTIISATPSDLEAGDNVTVDGNTLTLAATEGNGQDRVTFALDRQATEMTINLQIDGAYYPFNMRLGQARQVPATAPFRLVPPQPTPPVVQVEIESPVDEGSLLALTTAFTDTDSPFDHNIVWQMGDGTVITDTLIPSHSYADDGQYQVTLTVTDVHDMVGSASAAVTVTNVAPEVDFVSTPSRPEPGQDITFFGSVFDPGVADNHTYLWDFGDGATNTSSLTVTHSYAVTGTYYVALTVTDDDGDSGVISYTVEVEPFSADFTGYPGVAVTPFTATLYDISAGQVVSRTWDFGDGTPPLTSSESFAEHRYETPGVYDVSLTVSGPSGTDTRTRSGYIIAVSEATSNTIILEAEDYTSQVTGTTSTTWAIRTAQPTSRLWGYSGQGYIQATPDLDRQVELADLANETELEYKFGTILTGTYTIWLRGYAPNAAGDSVYLGLGVEPVTTTLVTGFGPRAWSWQQALTETDQPFTFTIDAPGIYTLKLWLREDGLALDQIIITKDALLQP